MGQLPGRDFVQFHGLAIAFAHYPIYALLGHNLFASEFSRQLLSPLAWVFAMTLLVHALVKNVRVTLYSMVLFAALSTVSDLDVSSSDWVYFLQTVFSPGPNSSLVPLRCAYPAACGISLIWTFGTPHTSPGRACVAGVCFGLAPAWSYEQGAYAASAAIISTCIRCFLRRHREGELLRLAAFLTFFAMTVWLWFQILTGGNGLQAMQFAFHTIPQNQGWYFGGPPNSSLAVMGPVLATDPVGYTELRWRYSAAVVSAYVAIILLSVSGLTTMIVLRKHLAPAPGTLIGCGFLTCLAVLSGTSLTGFLSSTYLLPAASSTMLIAISMASLWLRGSQTASVVVRNSVIASTITTLLATCIKESISFTREASSTTANVEISGVKPSKMYESLSPLIGRVRSIPGATVFSTYRGLLDIAVDQQPHGRVDYIIFAFSDEERTRFLNTFEQGHFTFVHTMRATDFIYEDWLHMMHWDFYKSLAERYAVVDTSAFSLLWQRRTQPIPLQSDACTRLFPDSQGHWIIPPARTSGFLEVTANYEIHNLLGSIPVLSGIPRYQIEHRGLGNRLAYTINPYHTSATWLIGRIANTPAWLNPKLYSPLPGATFTVKQIVACEITMPPGVTPAFNHLFFSNQGDSH